MDRGVLHNNNPTTKRKQKKRIRPNWIRRFIKVRIIRFFPRNNLNKSPKKAFTSEFLSSKIAWNHIDFKELAKIGKTGWILVLQFPQFTKILKWNSSKYILEIPTYDSTNRFFLEPLLKYNFRFYN